MLLKRIRGLDVIKIMMVKESGVGESPLYGTPSASNCREGGSCCSNAVRDDGLDNSQAMAMSRCAPKVFVSQ